MIFYFLCFIYIYRAVLSAIESSSTQALRLVLTRRLAEVLLRGVSPDEYTCPNNTSEPSMCSSDWLVLLNLL